MFSFKKKGVLAMTSQKVANPCFDFKKQRPF